jgi:hypothetical protein
MMTNQLTDVAISERIADLEIALSNEGWIPINGGNAAEFSRSGINSITELSRLYFIKNPLIKRGIRVRTFYVFGRGINIRAHDPTINELIQAFRDDRHNQSVLTGKQANKQRDIDLSVDGNLFFVFFDHPSTGHIRVDMVPQEQITFIIRDPDNYNKVLYYKREWSEHSINYATGAENNTRKIQYYRQYDNTDRKVTNIGGKPVADNASIYHIKLNTIGRSDFGISDAYVAQDWAKAYNRFLSDYASIIRSLARFAWRKKVSGGSGAVQAAKLRLNSTFAQPAGETRPAPVTGATSIETDGNELDPIKTAGATTSPEDARALRNMVATSFDIPETFYADVSTGNLATARSLDRPTELSFIDRQDLWESIYRNVFNAVIYYGVAAPNGALRSIATIETNEYNEQVISFDDDIDPVIEIGFPSILERDTLAYVQAIIAAATLDGKTPSVIPDMRWLASTLLSAIGLDDTDELIDSWYPDDTEQAPAVITSAVEALRNAINELKESRVNSEDLHFR